jgi:membrane-associated protease RseP (regulator of RpoE activity)
MSTEGGEQTFRRDGIDEVFYDESERNYLYLGNQALDSGDFELAHGFFRKALQIRPRFSEAEDALHRLKDLQEKAVALEMPLDPIAALQGRWGLILEPTADSGGSALFGGGHGLAVQGVGEGSLAERSGIAPGDVLVSVWGASLAFLPASDGAQALLGPSGSLVKLTLQRRVVLPAAEGVNRWWPGLTLDMEPLGLTVRSVDSRLEAGHRIRPRDRIVAVAGNSTRYWSLKQAHEILRQARRRGIPLVIHRDLMIKRE